MTQFVVCWFIDMRHSFVSCGCIFGLCRWNAYG